MSPPGRARRLAITAFSVFHVSALLWWNFGMVQLRPQAQEPPEGDGWTRMHEAVDTVDGSGRVRGVLTGYIRVSALFQQWVLFGPDAPHETGRIEVRGITGFDSSGEPILDPHPLHATEGGELTDTTQMIGNPPCGWSRAGSARATFLRASYAKFHASVAAKERGIDYVGVQFLCMVRPIHRPGEDPEGLAWRTEVLWAGPVASTNIPPSGPR
ncbi:MAG: hypothetical protein KUG77_02400 [Nannocystaceae bacterium]|nr:hypothetical protein [Nannocystaceae bacterium]